MKTEINKIYEEIKYEEYNLMLQNTPEFSAKHKALFQSLTETIRKFKKKIKKEMTK